MKTLEFNEIQPNRIYEFPGIPKAIKIIRYGDLVVLRDDLIPGGTKRRILNKILGKIKNSEVVYSSCQYGQGHLALSYSGLDLNKTVTLFYPNYSDFNSSFYKATNNLNANHYLIGNENINQIELDVYVKNYAALNNAYHIPIGFAMKEFENEIVELARSLPLEPKEVWALAGSGTLARALGEAWPDAEINVVSLGLPQCNPGNANIYMAPEDLKEHAEILPPYPSNPYYDAKLWRFVKLFASKDALIWNVA